MIIVTIKIKGEAATYTKKEFVDDKFDTSKANQQMYQLVEDAVKASMIDAVDTVVVTTRSEW